MKRARVLIISDSHGRTDRIDDVVRTAGAHDLLLHAGDHAEDVLGRHKNLHAVCGNCDVPGTAGLEEIFDVLGVKVLLTHGHALNVKTSPLPLIYRAAELDASLAVFGHTHTPALFVEDGRVFLNPGSLSYPRGHTACTYAVLELAEDGAGGLTGTFSFHLLDGTSIPAFDLVHRFS